MRHEPPAALADRWFRDGLDVLIRHPARSLLLGARSAGALLFHPGAFDLALVLNIENDESGRRLLEMLETAPLEMPALLVSHRPALAGMMAAALLLLAATYLGVILWLVRLRRGGGRAGPGLLVAVILYLLLASAGPEARARFRVPMMPLLVTLAAAGWVRSRPIDR
jgi:hypothetical protein